MSKAGNASVKDRVHTYMLDGASMGLPLIEHCGVNEMKEANPLDWQTHVGYKLVYSLSGSACYEFAGGERIEVKGNEFFVILPGHPHRGFHNVNDPSSLVWIIFDPRATDALERTTLSTADLRWIESRYEPACNDVTEFTQPIRALLAVFRKALLSILIGSTNPADLVNIRSVICQLIVESARELSSESEGATGNQVLTITQWIDRNYAQDIRVDLLAEELGICRSWLHRSFKRETGQTVIDYIQRYRVKVARSLLEGSSESITSIAYDCGFNSSQNFCKVFRKYTGSSPVQYRKSWGQGEASR